MHVLMTGGTGFIGSALCQVLRQRGHRLTILTRRPRPSSQDVIYMDDLDAIHASSDIDAVINLAGASLAGKRWTESYKREIISSRIGTTEALGELLSRLDKPPAVFLSASAIGYYGHQGDTELVEEAPVVPGFAQQLCERWETVALRAGQDGSRVCLMRLGVVLGPGGGALQQMTASSRVGVATWLGHGNQWLSWVHLQDVIAGMQRLLDDGSLSGAFNFTAPGAVTSRQFCAALRRHRRILLEIGVPGPVLKVALGEMATELLLNGQRVVPARLLDAGFEFAFPDIDSALADVLGSAPGR